MASVGERERAEKVGRAVAIRCGRVGAHLGGCDFAVSRPVPRRDEGEGAGRDYPEESREFLGYRGQSVAAGASERDVLRGSQADLAGRRGLADYGHGP